MQDTHPEDSLLFFSIFIFTEFIIMGKFQEMDEVFQAY